MDLRDYIILMTADSIVHHVYRGPQERPDNIKMIVAALEKVTRYLVERYYEQGYDVILARGRSFNSVKRSLPELQWDNYEMHHLTKAANEVRE